MALSGDDWARLVGILDDRFAAVTKKIEDHQRATETRMNNHSTQISGVMAGSIKAIAEHEEKHHDPVKKIGFMGTLIALGLGMVEGVRWMFKLGGGKGP